MGILQDGNEKSNLIDSFGSDIFGTSLKNRKKYIHKYVGWTYYLQQKYVYNTRIFRMKYVVKSSVNFVLVFLSRLSKIEIRKKIKSFKGVIR